MKSNYSKNKVCSKLKSKFSDIKYWIAVLNNFIRNKSLYNIKRGYLHRK